MTQLDLDYTAEIDRQDRQLDRVRILMADGQWRTLGAITDAVGGSEAGVSARLRDLRKPRNGAWQVDRRLVSTGLYEYRVRS